MVGVGAGDAGDAEAGRQAAAAAASEPVVLVVVVVVVVGLDDSKQLQILHTCSSEEEKLEKVHTFAGMWNDLRSTCWSFQMPKSSAGA